MGMSFKLCTEKSVRPSRSAWSNSFTNRPLPPTWSRVRFRIRSPVVVMVRISAWKSGKCSPIYPVTSSVCITARRLALLPAITFFIVSSSITDFSSYKGTGTPPG